MTYLLSPATPSLLPKKKKKNSWLLYNLYSLFLNNIIYMRLTDSTIVNHNDAGDARGLLFSIIYVCKSIVFLCFRSQDIRLLIYMRLTPLKSLIKYVNVVSTRWTNSKQLCWLRGIMTVHRLDKTNTKAIPTVCFLQKQELFPLPLSSSIPQVCL